MAVRRLRAMPGCWIRGSASRCIWNPTASRRPMPQPELRQCGPRNGAYPSAPQAVVPGNAPAFPEQKRHMKVFKLPGHLRPRADQVNLNLSLDGLAPSAHLFGSAACSVFNKKGFPWEAFFYGAWRFGLVAPWANRVPFTRACGIHQCGCLFQSCRLARQTTAPEFQIRWQSWQA